MVVLILFTLPVGLLLLHMKDAGVLMVALVPVEGGTDVRIVGRTSAQVQRMLDNALAVPAESTTTAGG